MASPFPRKALGLPLLLAMLVLLLLGGLWALRPAERAPAIVEATIVGFHGRMALARDDDKLLARVSLPGGALRQVALPKSMGTTCQAGDRVRLISHRHRLTVADTNCRRRAGSS